MSETIDVKLIEGTARSVADLFTNRKYVLDFYQREYTWSSANINELLEDLADAFLRDYNPEHERKAVAKYQPYFLGPVVTAAPSGALNLVDGQQRLTSLTLLLIHLDRLAKEQELGEALESYVFSKKYGEPSFNLDVDERAGVMTAILNGDSYEPQAGDSNSVRTIWDRYEDIANSFPEELAGDALPYFIDWLLERVVLVEIRTTDQEMALEIFETMNDRGTQLSPTDMLKTFMLVGIDDSDEIEEANDLWRKRMAELKNNHADFIKTWLRAKYASTISKATKETSQDFELIGNAFHKWARDHAKDRIGLNKPADYKSLVNKDFSVMAARYMELLDASEKLTTGLEAVRYNAVNRFSLQYLPILAAVTPGDDQETFTKKAGLISSYIDLLVTRTLVNYRSTAQSTMRKPMFELAKELRNRDIEDVRSILAKRVLELDITFDGLSQYVLRTNVRQVRYLLSRITTWLEQQCEVESSFETYMTKRGKNPFEIEHIWSTNAKEADSFASALDFATYRSRIGDLILLPKTFNASYGDMPYEKKLPHYFGQNLLAKSLHPDAYTNNPKFKKLISTTGLPFQPYPEGFTKDSIDERQDLYQRILELIWDPATLGLTV